MRRKAKWIIIPAAIVLGVGVGFAFWYLSHTLPVGTGHVAKTLCSNVFIAGRDADTVFREDIAPVSPLFAFTAYKVDRSRKMVIATALALFRSKAVYREDCGCTLVRSASDLESSGQPLSRKGGVDSNLPWPAGEGPAVAIEGVSSKRLQYAIDRAFAETDTKRPKRTRAVVIVYDGRLVAERYAPGIDRKTPLLGWSMSKSVTNALLGILVRQGKLKIDEPAPVPEWRNTEDSKGVITLDQLMRMSSGLSFSEIYAPLSDAVEMFYRSRDFAAYAAAKPLIAQPGSAWHYSSGTANILSRIVRDTAAPDYHPYYRFLYEELFDRIGMHSAVFEPDPSGTFVGSSYMFATARDWARFGLLYLQDGVWEGERVLPEGWVKYSTTPVPFAPKGKYGALFWLNAGTPSDPMDRRWPAVPCDAYSAEGFQGQRVIVIPSKKLVLVRLGNSAEEAAWNDEAFITDVMGAVP